MKRLLALVLCFAMALAMIPVAQADAGMPQSVATYFSDAKFNDYTIVDCVELNNYCFALLKHGKENLLYGFHKSNGGAYKYWIRNKAAVPQGANKVEMAVCTGMIVDGCNLTLNNPSFYIMYDNAKETDVEQMVFYSLVSGNWLLKAYINTDTDVSVAFNNDTLTYYRYSGHSRQGAVQGNFQRDIRHISVSYIPNTLKRAQNQLTTPPELPSNSELIAENVKFTGGQKYAVYSGPGKDFLRGGNNKAAVSTNDWIQVFGEEDGWLLVQYGINKNTYRFGYIEASALPKKTTVKMLDFNACEAITTADVAMTDDPLFSATTLTSMPADTQVTWLASMGDWAYIATEIDNTPVRGFVPANALELVEMTIDEADAVG